MKLMIATPALTGADTDYVGSLVNTLRYCHENRISVELYFLKGCSNIGFARNNCAGYFMRSGADKLLFIDADQVWSNEQLAALLATKRPLVGGTYLKKTTPFRLNFNPLPGYGDKDPRDPANFAAYAKLADETGEIEVTHVPTGFMLIDRCVFTTLAEKCPTYLSRASESAEEFRYWDFFPSGVLNGTYMTEDWFFCSQAAAAGFPPYLQTRAIVDHIGQYNYRMPREVSFGGEAVMPAGAPVGAS